LFWTAVAVDLNAPVPVRFGSWFSPSDMPESVMKRGTGLWLVPIRINVGPNGQVQSCEVELTSGIADLDKVTCRVIMRRAKFGPARTGGIPSYGVYRTSVRWLIADAPFDHSKVSSPDIDLTVQRLPSTVRSPALVTVMFAVDAQGRKSSCRVDDSKEMQPPVNHPALVAIACEQVMSQYEARPAKDAAGMPVASVQNALVRFSATRSK
jgi:hypothetical protein